MKKLIVLFMVFITIVPIFGQVNRYSKPAKSSFKNTYVSPNWNQLERTLQTAQNMHDKNAAYADAMITIIYDIKGNIESPRFEKDLNIVLNSLKQIRQGALYNKEVELKKLEWKLRDTIEKYKKGRYTENTKTPDYFKKQPRRERIPRDTSNVKIIETGERYLIKGAVRDRASISGNVMAKFIELTEVRVLSKSEGVYYHIEFKDTTGYVSIVFIIYKIGN